MATDRTKFINLTAPPGEKSRTPINAGLYLMQRFVDR